jgi:2-dehydro-3-deoxygluconokinase
VGRIAFDPNVRPALWADPAEARESLTTAFGVADIVLASHDDGAWLWGESEPNAQIERILTFGAREAVVTLGAGGVTLFADGEAATAPSLAGVIIDTSGAGDSFNGGYLAARLRGASPLEAARAGQSLAARVVAQPGALIASVFSHPKSATPPTDAL